MKKHTTAAIAATLLCIFTSMQAQVKTAQLGQHEVLIFVHGIGIPVTDVAGPAVVLARNDTEIDYDNAIEHIRNTPRNSIAVIRGMADKDAFNAVGPIVNANQNTVLANRRAYKVFETAAAIADMPQMIVMDIPVQNATQRGVLIYYVAVANIDEAGKEASAIEEAESRMKAALQASAAEAEKRSEARYRSLREFLASREQKSFRVFIGVGGSYWYDNLRDSPRGFYGGLDFETGKNTRVQIAGIIGDGERGLGGYTAIIEIKYYFLTFGSSFHTARDYAGPYPIGKRAVSLDIGFKHLFKLNEAGQEISIALTGQLVADLITERPDKSKGLLAFPDKRGGVRLMVGLAPWAW